MKNTTLGFLLHEKRKELSRLFCMLIFILVISVNVNSSAQTIVATKWYSIESATSHKLLDVKLNSTAAGTQIWQYNIDGSTAQHFHLVLCTGGYYEISTDNGLLMSLKYNSPTTNGGAFYSLIQDVRYVKPTKIVTVPPPGTVADPTTLQHWTLIRAGADSLTYILQSVAFPTQVLQPTDNNSQSAIQLTTKTGVTKQQWIVVTSSDMMVTQNATQAELTEFSNIKNNQLGVGVLGGETTQPFYYHTNPTWRYKKLIDPSQVVGAGMQYVNGKLTAAGNAIGDFSVVLLPVQGLDFGVTEIVDIGEYAVKEAEALYDFLTNSTPSVQWAEIDDWYPVSAYRTTACGSIKEAAHICTQDFDHTELTIDKDVCFVLSPNSSFTGMLTNPINQKVYDHIEGEVRAENAVDLNSSLSPTPLNLQPRNPVLMPMAVSDKVCLYGPWMLDNLNPDGIGTFNDNNEIHPVNQFWRNYGSTSELELISVVDGSGYFLKTGTGEVQASGLNQRMSFYVAVQIPYSNLIAAGNNYIEYDINGIGYDYLINGTATIPASPSTTTFNYDGKVRLKIVDNSAPNGNEMTHTPVIFDKVRTMPDGSIQGYIVIQTNPITRPGGSINTFVTTVIH